MLIDELTNRGILEPSRLYELPYMGIAPHGPEQLCSTEELAASLKP